MTTNLQKWGNSQGIRIPKSIIDEVKWKENEKILMVVEDGKVVLKKAEEERNNINELFKNYNGNYDPIDVDWGEPVGDEIW